MENNTEDRVELKAMKLVARYYEAKGYKVENVSRARGEHAGYDFMVTKGVERLNVEVKGCTRQYGIPDPYITEFDSDTRRLIADVLCVVYFLSDTEPPQLAIIPRDKIPPEFVIPKFGYRISGKFKKASVINGFIVPIEEEITPLRIK
jgi:hypothetical protein